MKHNAETNLSVCDMMKIRIKKKNWEKNENYQAKKMEFGKCKVYLEISISIWGIMML
jgi:hypothetical protein